MSQFKIEPHYAPTVHVYNLDYDGCLDNELSEDKFIQKIIWDCSQNKHCTEVVISLGSLRQFIYTDIYNAHNNASYHDNRYVSCSRLVNEFPIKLEKALKATFKDKAPKVKRVRLLNSDIYNQLAIGKTLDHMTDDNCEKFLHPDKILARVGLDITDNNGEYVSNYDNDTFKDWLCGVYTTCDSNEEDIDAYLKRHWGLGYDELENYLNYRNEFNRLFNITATNQKGETVTLLSLNKPGASGIENVNCGNSIHFPDTSKIIALYNLGQFIGSRIKDCFRIYQADDVEELLDGLEIACTQCPGFLPENASFQGIDWYHDEEFDPQQQPSRKIFYGNGIANTNFAQDIRELVLGNLIDKIFFKDEKADRNTVITELATLYPKVLERKKEREQEQKQKQEQEQEQEQKQEQKRNREQEEQKTQNSANYSAAMYPTSTVKAITPKAIRQALGRSFDELSQGLPGPNV